MAIQFILGRSGSGKTTYCIEAIVRALAEAADQQLILLVPEQATYQAERAILADKKVAGYNRLNVLSFDRLQFMLSGRNTARPILSGIGRQMIIHRILRDNRSKLGIFGSSSAWPGLSRQMAHTIAELHEYTKTPDDIEQLLSELQNDDGNRLAALKFADIGLILREYLQFIEGKFVDPDLQLARACRAVADAGFVKGAKLWVDGFAGFTAAELAILAELLKVVADARIALCLDPGRIDWANPGAPATDGVSLFSPTERTYVDLVEMVRGSKLKLDGPVILEKAPRFAACRPLAHVERSIFEFEPARIDAAGSVRTVSAPNARAEVRFVARQILELVRDRGCRYRDIAVIASDIESYQHYIRAYFEDFGIPFFIDKRKPLNHHPIVQLVCSALQVVTGRFSHPDIFAYLKTDLVPVPRGDVDMLENYCLAFGISARDWQSDRKWDFAAGDKTSFDERQINRIRLKISRPLLDLQDSLCAPEEDQNTISPDQFAQAVFSFLDVLDTNKTIARWITQANERNDPAAVDEHQQFYNKFVDIFDELIEVFEGCAMTAEDYLAIVNSAFSQLTLAFIPPTLDQVLVGSIERSRHPDLKAVFLIGATQRQFPVPISSNSILTDADRLAAESADFQLAATSSQGLTERQYLAYIAFTRPSQFLCVTYPAADEKGGAVPRSQFMDDLESLFEDLSEEAATDAPADVDKIAGESELVDLLCAKLGRDRLATGTCDESTLDRLLHGMSSDEQLARSGSQVRAALEYDNAAGLDKDVVDKHFGNRMRSSATRLSTFAACPYRHFARYILQLRKREEFKFEPLDLGRFYHRILDALTKRITTEGRDFAAIENDELVRLLREEIEKLIKADSFISNFVSRRGYNEFIIRSAGDVLEDCVLAISQMVRSGSFRPALSEVSFGQVKDACETLGECEFALADGRVLSLDGKIDRLDASEETTIVFDYKRRDTSFSWPTFYHGLDMQLPIYMLAVRKSAGDWAKNVAGAFFMPIEVSPAKTTLAKLSQRGEAFDYKAKGIFDGRYARHLDAGASKDSKYYNFYVTKDGQPYGSYGNRGALKPDAFEKMLRFAEEKIVRLAVEISSGKIEIAPYRLNQNSPCSYCEFKSACRFDWQINEYNSLEALNKVQVLERLEVDDG